MPHPTSLRITALKYAQSVLSEAMCFAGGREEKKLPISFTVYLIEEEDRKILVDAGCDTMPGFVMEYFVSPVEILARLGKNPEEITDLVITHAHHDHIEAAPHFSKAVIHIQQEEYAAGKRYLPAEAKVQCFVRETQISPSVRVLCIGGHAKGSSIVTVAAGEKTYVICGDECYQPECLTQRIPTGASCCPEKSRAFVEEYSREQYVPLLCHDPRILPDQNGVVDIL